ncbi:hypothetical protein HDU85_007284 [Gaertneriomyces sp. JEL0708]|nr:hypothetical protein HDU85_007284 [Gaertneriomyces sp. JEL0708]
MSANDAIKGPIASDGGDADLGLTGSLDDLVLKPSRAEANPSPTKAKGSPLTDHGEDSNEDLGDLSGMGDAPPISPVPTMEERPSFQAATIDKVSPSVAVIAEEHRQHLTEKLAQVSKDIHQQQSETQAGTALSLHDASTAPVEGVASNDHAADDLDEIFAQLLAMGFEVEKCEMAIEQAFSIKEGTKDDRALLDIAVAWIVSNSGDGEASVRGVSYSPHHSPKPSRPPPREARPSRSILKGNLPSSSEPRDISPTPKKDGWLAKQLDQAAGAITSTFVRVKKQLSTPEGTSNETSSNSLEAAQPPKLTPAFVVGDAGRSNDSLNEIIPSIASDDDPSRPDRHVRFSFPDVTIDPDPAVAPDEEAHASEAGAAPARPDRTSSKDLYESIAAPGSVLPKTSINTADDLLAFYYQTCSMKDEEILDKVVAQLQDAIQRGTHIHALDLSSTTLNTDNASSIADVIMTDYPISSLLFEHCQFDDESLRVLLSAILKRSDIKHLSLAYSKKVRNNGQKYLSTFVARTVSLTHLDVSGISFDSGSLPPFLRALQENFGVTTLHMNGCGLGSGGLKALATIIPHSRIQHLSIRANRISGDISAALAALVQPGNVPGEGLLSLDISDNQISKGMAALASALGANNQLVELRLANNKEMSAEALSAFAGALRTNSTLQVLDINGNSLAAESQLQAITSLKDALGHNGSLTDLCLSKINLTSEATIALAEALPLNKSLRRLDMRYNPIALAGVMALAVSMRMNSSIVQLEVAPTLGRVKEDTDVANMLNDIDIYCQRNAEILRSQGEADWRPASPAKEASVGSSNAMAVDAEALQRTLTVASETASVLDEMMHELGPERSASTEELVQQLYDETKRAQKRVQEAASAGAGLDEGMLASLLATNDRLESSLSSCDQARIRSGPSKPTPSDKSARRQESGQSALTKSDSLSNFSDIDIFEAATEDPGGSGNASSSKDWDDQMKEMDDFLNSPDGRAGPSGV